MCDSIVTCVDIKPYGAEGGKKVYRKPFWAQKKHNHMQL